ncbi:MAG TPA: GNAT family N-acetyltransferase [Magnetospirillaceae bacterium]
MTRDLRLTVATDAALLAALHQGFDDPWDQRAFATLLTTPGVFGVLAGRDEPLGFILCRIAADEAEVLTLFVLETARRHGVATALLDRAIDAARAAKATALFLEVAETNAPARGFYAAQGFMQVGRRPRYYKNAVDALILKKEISP